MRKQFSSLLMLGAVASGLFLTSCNKNKGAETPDVQQNVVVSLDLGSAGLRAAMGSTQASVADATAGTVNVVDVYLSKANGDITKSKRFKSTETTDFNKLVNPNAVGQPSTTGGYKFLDVDAATVKATVIVNPQSSAIIAEGGNLSSVEQVAVKATVGDAIYAATKSLESAGIEEYGVDPQTNKAVVKKAEFTLKGNMNRFQIVNKFCRIVYKTNKEGKSLVKEWLEAHPGKTYADFKTAADGLNDGAFNNGNPTGNWADYYEIEDITNKNVGVFMNNFDNKYNPITDVATDRLFAKTFAGTYTTTDGTWTPDGSTDVSESASYYKSDGFTTAKDGEVFAFNYFTKNVTDYSDATKSGNAPRLHFFFKDDKIDSDHQFVNIVGYNKESGNESLVANDVNGNHLLNIDLSDTSLNNGNGIVVTSVDPEAPGSGKPDITNEAFNVIVRVQVENWVATKVKPIVE